MVLVHEIRMISKEAGKEFDYAEYHGQWSKII